MTETEGPANLAPCGSFVYLDQQSQLRRYFSMHDLERAQIHAVNIAETVSAGRDKRSTIPESSILSFWLINRASYADPQRVAPSDSFFHPRVGCDPVYFPGLASIIRECLFKTARIQ